MRHVVCRSLHGLPKGKIAQAHCLSPGLHAAPWVAAPEAPLSALQLSPTALLSPLLHTAPESSRKSVWWSPKAKLVARTRPARASTWATRWGGRAAAACVCEHARTCVLGICMQVCHTDHNVCDMCAWDLYAGMSYRPQCVQHVCLGSARRYVIQTTTCATCVLGICMQVCHTDHNVCVMCAWDLHAGISYRPQRVRHVCLGSACRYVIQTTTCATP